MVSAVFVGLVIQIVSSSCNVNLITPHWFSAKLWDKFDFSLLAVTRILESFSSNNGAVNHSSLMSHIAVVTSSLFSVVVAC